MITDDTLIRPPHKQGFAPVTPVEAKVIKHEDLGWIAVIGDRAWFVEWNGSGIPTSTSCKMLVVDEHEGKEHIGKDYYVKVVGMGKPTLMKLLHDAHEFHSLTVVRMSMKDLAEGHTEAKVIQGRLVLDMDKLRMAETDAGKRLHEYVYKRIR